MNRKKTSKIKNAVTQAVNTLHLLDDPLEWMKGDVPCPWTNEQIIAWQKRLDSAFGAENAFVLAWSYDRHWWDEMYMDTWHFDGTPIGRPQKIPLLLFKEIAVDKDTFYISTPRFLILETLHGSQLEASWEEIAWAEDKDFIGGKKRIRTEKPPEKFYRVVKTIARHEQSVVRGAMRPCCQRMWDTGRSICYGKYRPPSDEDLMEFRGRREALDREGIVQRNDAPRDPKVLALAAASTKHFMKQAAQQRRGAVQDMILANPKQYMGDVFKNYGITMNATEIERTLKEGFERQEKEII